MSVDMIGRAATPEEGRILEAVGAESVSENRWTLWAGQTCVGLRLEAIDVGVSAWVWVYGDWYYSGSKPELLVALRECQASLSRASLRLGISADRLAEDLKMAEAEAEQS